MNKFISGIMLLAMLAAFSAPAMADYAFDGFPLQTRVSGTINGETFSDYAAWDGSTDITLTTYVPSGTIKYAYLYTGTWCGNPTNAGDVEVTFNGNGAGTYCDDGYEFGSIHIAGASDGNPNVWCSGFGKSWWYYNVTSLVVPGATNTARNQNIDVPYGNVYGVVLVVVLENSSKPLIQYWINDGSDGLNYDTPHNSGTTDFSGVVDQPNVAKSALTGIVITGYSPSCQNCMKFNNHLMYTGHITSNSFWMGTWDEIGSVVTPANVTDGTTANNFWYDRGGDGFVNICLGLLELQLTSATEPDLEPTDIEFPKVMRPGKSHTIDATIVNQGYACESFDVSLYANNDLEGTVTVAGGLAASGSTTVSFPNVNLPKDCYTFKVVADSGGAISESDEGNNEISEDYQVGYVIVVESDAEFAELSVTGAYALPSGCFVNDGGTYYIQDLTGSYAVENCDLSCNDGNGITIKGTTATFVIRDCTIQNCANSGVFLHDLVDGTVENCIVQDNTRYGIEVGEVPLNSDDPKFVSISNNELYDNLYGIELIATESTVTCNTIRDNREDGIYVFGNDNKLCNNIIENSTDYGMKVYNSNGNRIYWNSFTNNNGGGVQGYDNSATNTWNQVNKNYPYDGSIYTDYTGNYWDDHTAPDAGGDGIVDTPYTPLDGSAGAADSYPLVTLPWTFDIPIYNGMNAISIPLYQDDPTLDGVFGDIAVTNDKVRRFVNGDGYQSATYYAGYGWYENLGEHVEPIEPKVGYVYEQVGASCTLTVNGTRLCLSTVETPIFNGMNLIGYLNFTQTDLSTFNSPITNDKVRRFVNGDGYQSATYYAGYGWYENLGEHVNPIEVGVGYYYERVGSDYVWTYEV